MCLLMCPIVPSEWPAGAEGSGNNGHISGKNYVVPSQTGSEEVTDNWPRVARRTSWGGEEGGAAASMIAADNRVTIRSFRSARLSFVLVPTLSIPAHPTTTRSDDRLSRIFVMPVCCWSVFRLLTPALPHDDRHSKTRYVCVLLVCVASFKPRLTRCTLGYRFSAPARNWLAFSLPRDALARGQIFMLTFLLFKQYQVVNSHKPYCCVARVRTPKSLASHSGFQHHCHRHIPHPRQPAPPFGSRRLARAPDAQAATV